MELSKSNYQAICRLGGITTLLTVLTAFIEAAGELAGITMSIVMFRNLFTITFSLTLYLPRGFPFYIVKELFHTFF